MIEYVRTVSERVECRGTSTSLVVSVDGVRLHFNGTISLDVTEVGELIRRLTAWRETGSLEVGKGD